jgi:tRNA(Ser,Leu) C12 N-acetylase TAN1
VDAIRPVRKPDWNVLAMVYDGEFREGLRLLVPFGDVRASDYRNVLTMKVADVGAFLEAVRSTLEHDASLANAVSRVAPATHGFRFSSPEDFETKARDVVAEWVPEICAKRFHVRMHRRGFKGKLSSLHEEQFLDHFLLESAKAAGSPAAIDFTDPDIVISVETLGPEAGLARWTRAQLERYDLLRLD